MSIIATMDLHVAPGSAPAALAELDAILAETSLRDGFIDVTVIVDHADPEHIVLIEQWESLAHDTAYRAWRRSLPPNEAFAALLIAPPALTHHDVARHVLPPRSSDNEGPIT